MSYLSTIYKKEYSLFVDCQEVDGLIDQWQSGVRQSLFEPIGHHRVGRECRDDQQALVLQVLEIRRSELTFTMDELGHVPL